jgi:hypothetical protein
MAFHNIASVSLKGAQGLVLNTGIGPISLSNVEEIWQG